MKSPSTLVLTWQRPIIRRRWRCLYQAFSGMSLNLYLFYGCLIIISPCKILCSHFIIFITNHSHDNTGDLFISPKECQEVMWVSLSLNCECFGIIINMAFSLHLLYSLCSPHSFYCFVQSSHSGHDYQWLPGLCGIMDSDLPHHHDAPHFTERCACRREFHTIRAVSNHKHTWKKAKTHQFGALEKVNKVFWAAKNWSNQQNYWQMNALLLLYVL